MTRYPASPVWCRENGSTGLSDLLVALNFSGRLLFRTREFALFHNKGNNGNGQIRGGRDNFYIAKPREDWQ
jgi:hypothetical protein